MLGQVIGRQAGVAVHVVFADIQHSGHFQHPAGGWFPTGSSTAPSRTARVILSRSSAGVPRLPPTATALPAAAAISPTRWSRCFRVGTVIANDRRLGLRANSRYRRQLHAARRSGCRPGVANATSQGCISSLGAAQKLDIQLATTHFHVRVAWAQSVTSSGGFWPGVGHGKRHARRQIRRPDPRSCRGRQRCGSGPKRSGTLVIPQFQGLKADQYENHGDDPEPDDHAARASL